MNAAIAVQRYEMQQRYCKMINKIAVMPVQYCSECRLDIHTDQVDSKGLTVREVSQTYVTRCPHCFSKFNTLIIFNNGQNMINDYERS